MPSYFKAELAGRRGLYDNCREDCCFLLSIPHTPYYIQVMALQLLATLPGISNQTRLAYLEDAVARLERMKEIDNDEGVQTLERTTVRGSAAFIEDSHVTMDHTIEFLLILLPACTKRRDQGHIAERTTATTR